MGVDGADVGGPANASFIVPETANEPLSLMVVSKILFVSGKKVSLVMSSSRYMEVGSIYRKNITKD